MLIAKSAVLFLLAGQVAENSVIPDIFVVQLPR